MARRRGRRLTGYELLMLALAAGAFYQTYVVTHELQNAATKLRKFWNGDPKPKTEAP